jgi:hypothetical protein
MPITRSEAGANILVIYNHPPLALPHRQSHVIDPFVKWSAGGILVQLVLNADHIRPSSSVNVPGLIESIGLAVAVEADRICCG